MDHELGGGPGSPRGVCSWAGKGALWGSQRGGVRPGPTAGDLSCGKPFSLHLLGGTGVGPGSSPILCPSSPEDAPGGSLW